MKRNKENFFEQMRTYKTSTREVDIVCSIIEGICFIIEMTILSLMSDNKIKNNQVAVVFIIICLIITIGVGISRLSITFEKNGIKFLAGNFFAGLKNFFIVILPVYIILIVLYIVFPSWQKFLLSVITVFTSIAVAVLTIMGIHYTIAKQQNRNDEERNLIFTICNDDEILNNHLVTSSRGNKTIKINLKNISNNFGYLIGLYEICGCDAHQIGDKFPYLPIAPQDGYSITNIKMNLGDDQLIIVYKDISENYYYLLISSNYKHIESSGKCDMDFLRWRISMTKKSEKKFADKLQKQALTVSQSEELLDEESLIMERKENTKPVYTQRENGFDLIVSSDGVILTDMTLLNKLKKERTKLSKDQQVKAYMIFNNQQLVAMATYKPCDELSFISIYGLGKKKYELYGSKFISIIAEHVNE